MARGESLRELGAVPEPSFEKVVRECGVIFTMVSNDAIHNNLITSALNAQSQGGGLKDKIFVDCSTIHPQTVGLTATKLQEHGANFLAAPVFGGQGIAVDGKLVFALGGPEKARGVVRPLIEGVMGRRVIECGDDAMRASMLKIAGFVYLSVSHGLSVCLVGDADQPGISLLSI